MQSRSGSRYCLDDSTRNEVEKAEHRICDPSKVIVEGHAAIVTVGDYTTEVIEKLGARIKLQIVDLKTKRMEKYEHRPGAVQVVNPAGCISDDLIAAVRKALSGDADVRIEVEGEEDLAVIPVIMAAEDDTVVFYGVPDTGMACITVNMESRIRVRDIFQRMVRHGQD
ncbi:MAG: DUF359 domain-containing protein [Candidatus Thermoplasmatota archaeon]|nr:DUF359 domain-containing protein [Candidatus Thermoplasmatota archaeon]MCL5731284.1 DUF359 domain-containing protein [Candidatus Thermoplasmatota archaeon]